MSPADAFIRRPARGVAGKVESLQPMSDAIDHELNPLATERWSGVAGAASEVRGGFRCH
jgi:hypothetical protein